MIRALLVLLCIGLARARPVEGQTAVVDSTPGPFPSWDWQASDLLLTSPWGQCGPRITPPGTLVEAHLLAWTTRADAMPNIHTFSVIWWGRYRAASGESRWALARGFHHELAANALEREHPWSLTYLCDGGGHPYAVFDRAPTAEEIRGFSEGFVGSPVNQPVLEIGVRRGTLQQLAGDSLAIGGPLFRIRRP